MILNFIKNLFKKKPVPQTVEAYFDDMFSDGCRSCHYYDDCTVSKVRLPTGEDGFCTTLDDDELAMSIDDFTNLRP